MLIPEDYADLLEWDTRAFASVATIGPGGVPHCSPLWFDWDGHHVLFSLTTTRQKYRNMGRDRRVAMAIVDPSDPYRYLEIRGELEEVEPDPDIDFISRLAKKYLGKERYPWHREGDERVVMKIRPVAVSDG